MSRSTQYVGLNHHALNLVKDAFKREEYEMTTGMFEEPVSGTIYHVLPPPGPNKALKYVEVVQTTPWSSGPMIFTHLKAVLTKECGQEIETGECCSWILDPSLEDTSEVDYVTGRYYV